MTTFIRCTSAIAGVLTVSVVAGPAVALIALACFAAAFAPCF